MFNPYFYPSFQFSHHLSTSSQLHVLFIIDFLNSTEIPLSNDCVFLGVGSSSGVWSISQGSAVSPSIRMYKENLEFAIPVAKIVPNKTERKQTVMTYPDNWGLRKLQCVRR